jgi:flagellar biogenesis protein FliO
MFEILTTIFQLVSSLFFIGIPIALIWFIVWMVKKVNRIETHLETIARNMEKGMGSE